MSARSVCVVGGGAVGLSVAWRASLLGTDVTVVDDGIEGRASWAAAGMLAPVTEVHYGEEALLALNLASARLYSDWIGELERSSGVETGYRRTGTLMVARDSDDNAALEEVYNYQLKLNLDARRLKSAECRGLEPMLAPSVRGGIHVAEDHQVDNRALVRALRSACERSGVAFVSGRAESVMGSSRAEGVLLSDGSQLEAKQVVLAAGSWSNGIGGLASGTLPPVRPVKGQALHIRSRTGSDLMQRTIRGLDVYIVPRSDGRAVIGATVEEQGFDTTITAGAVMDLLRYAYELVPGLAEYELTEVVCGLRPVSSDNQPLLGPTDVPGLSVATGHFRNGVLLAPVTGDLMAQYLEEDSVPEMMEPFLPSRFARAGAAS